MMKTLEACRAEIDAIDAQLVRLFEQRMRVSRDVALYKQAHHMDILDTSRESIVLDSRAAQVEEDALRQPARELFSALMSLSREEQARFLAGCRQDR